MEFEIKKEGNEKYLSILKNKFEEDDYRIQMLLNNQIKGLLPIKIRNINSEKELLYDITAMSSLESIYGRNHIKKEELIKLLIAIKQLEDSLNEYLLCCDDVKFDLNYIYYKEKQKQIFFCYCPGGVEDYALQMKGLFNQILDYVNYNDREAVTLAYGIQEITSRDDFAVEELLDYALSKKEEIKPIEVEDDEEEFIYEENDEEEKQSLLDKIKNIFRKEKKKEEYDEEDIYIEETQNEEDFNYNTDNLSDEEATVLLTGNATDYIVLKSSNHNPELIVVPDKYPFVIGKSKRSCDYKVSSDVVSRVHARINLEMGIFSIEDLNSTNGTFVNEERLKPHEIRQFERGDVITIADIEFSVE